MANLPLPAVRGGTPPETVCTADLKSRTIIFIASNAGRSARVELSA